MAGFSEQNDCNAGFWPLGGNLNVDMVDSCLDGNLKACFHADWCSFEDEGNSGWEFVLDGIGCLLALYSTCWLKWRISSVEA